MEIVAGQLSRRRHRDGQRQVEAQRFFGHPLRRINGAAEPIAISDKTGTRLKFI
jgi:hypothetical protein